MPFYAIDGLVPVVDPSAFVHPTAVVIGDVIIGPGVYVGPCASLRGDFGRLVLQRGSNLQDNCTMHGFPGSDTVVEEKNQHIAELKAVSQRLESGRVMRALNRVQRLRGRS